MLCVFRAVRRSLTGASCAARMEMCSVSPSACLGSWSVGQVWSEAKGLSPGPEAWLSRAGSQCQRHWERWLSPARRVATHVRSVCHARVDPELSGSLKSQGFRCQYEGFCQARAPFAASHPGLVDNGRNQIWRRFRVFCLLSVKVCSWYKTHSNTGIFVGVRYVFFLSVPGFQFGPVTVLFEVFSGHKQ